MKMPYFLKMILIKVIKPEKLNHTINEFIIRHQSKSFTSTNASSITDVFGDTDYKTPLLFVLSSGVDPISGLLRLAHEREMSTDLVSMISLGQGQGTKAIELIRNGIRRGHWVVVQNCHLGKSFMHNLEAIVDWIQSTEPHRFIS
jgi:dynein heavy chain, axonemal